MPGSFPRGRICWHDLLTNDPKAAIAFYTKIAGWGTQPWDQDPSYVMWTARGAPLGGVMPLPEDARRMGAPPAWRPYIAVPDVGATVRQANALGGRTTVQPQDIPTVGRFAVLADPPGATFGVIAPTGQPPGHDGEPKLGEFSWHEIVTTDWRATWSFYEQLFGWVKMQAMDMGPMGTYQIFGRAGIMLGGIYNRPPGMPAPPHWLSYVLVPNADQAAAAVPRLGGKLLNGPMDVPGGDRVAQCVDPQGAAFAVHSKGAAAATAAKPRAKPARKATKPAKRAKAAAKRSKKKPARTKSRRRR